MKQHHSIPGFGKLTTLAMACALGAATSAWGQARSMPIIGNANNNSNNANGQNGDGQNPPPSTVSPGRSAPVYTPPSRSANPPSSEGGQRHYTPPDLGSISTPPQNPTKPGHLLPIQPVQPGNPSHHHHDHDGGQIFLPNEWWGLSGWTMGITWGYPGDAAPDNGPGPQSVVDNPVPPMLPPDTGLQITPAAQAKAAQAVMDEIQSAAQDQLKSSSTYQLAIRAQGVAQQNFDAACGQVQSALYDNKDYMALLQKRDVIEHKIVLLHRESDNASYEQLSALAEQNLKIGKEMERIKTKVMAGDMRVQQAQQELVTATTRLQGLLDSVATTVASDPTWQAARRIVEQNR